MTTLVLEGILVVVRGWGLGQGKDGGGYKRKTWGIIVGFDLLTVVMDTQNYTRDKLHGSNASRCTPHPSPQTQHTRRQASIRGHLKKIGVLHQCQYPAVII